MIGTSSKLLSASGRSINDIEIMTFDELFDRARFIVEHTTA